MKTIRGYTLIELVVAMSIFTVIATVAVSSFITLTKLKSLALNMRESQQKIRVASETVTRLAKQANYVDISSSSAKFYYLTSSGSYLAYKFDFVSIGGPNYDLVSSKCTTSPLTNPPCTSWSSSTTLLGGSANKVNLDNASLFQLNLSNGQPELNLFLHGTISGVAPYYNDDFTFDTAAYLEGLR